MSLSNICKALLPIRCNGAAGRISRNIANSSVLHSIFYIKNADDYEQLVNKAEKPIVVSFYSPMSPKSKLQYERLQEIMKNLKAIDLVHVDVTKYRIIDQMEVEDLWALPLLTVFDYGKIVQRLSGSHSKVSLRTWLEKAYSEAHFKIKYDF